MQADNIVKNRFLLESEGLNLQVFTAFPTSGEPPCTSVQIHHGGCGYENIYPHMIEDLAKPGFIVIAMIHRGYPGVGLNSVSTNLGQIHGVEGFHGTIEGILF